jgi:putative two-component system response regulator
MTTSGIDVVDQEGELEPTCSVLVVEDDELQQSLIRDFLERHGHSVTVTADGEEAIRTAQRIVPDIVLLDIRLDGIDGYEVCKRLRIHPILSEVYVLMLTGLRDRDARLKGFESGADDFITKPFDEIELATRIRTITRLSRYRRLVEERDENMLLVSDLHAAYNATLEGWGQALEMRDRDTEGHTQRVSNLTIHLARRMKVDEEAQIHLYRGALLHDIGKIGVPDRILHKEGPLDSDEWEIMRKHPQLAHDMLGEIEFLRPALEIPHCHHEWYDGSGYPQGLKGDDIPLSARIFSVVDVWDALSFDRPYRKAMSQPDVIAHMLSRRGTHFDPHVTDEFVDIIGDMGPGILKE